MDEHHLRTIIRETVKETLSGIGFEVSEPLSLQADMLYLRKLRLGAEDMLRRARASFITVAVSTGLFLLWQAVKTIIGNQ